MKAEERIKNTKQKKQNHNMFTHFVVFSCFEMFIALSEVKPIL